MFEPFFTTKEEWSCKGLGLSSVNQMIELQHGKISVDSEPGMQTTFTVTLPAYRARSLA